jgi:hypothetical protein
MIANYVKAGLICLCVLGMSNNSVAQTSGAPVKNIVLVHGAWADGSGWKGVYDILVKDGYNISIVQEPETSFKEDVAATLRTLALQDGPSSHTVEVAGASHSVYVSHPKEVADVIESAARAVSK